MSQLVRTILIFISLAAVLGGSYYLTAVAGVHALVPAALLASGLGAGFLLPEWWVLDRVIR